MLTQISPFAGKRKGRSFFWIGIQIGVIVALVIWWYLENQPKEGVKPTPKPVVLPSDEPKAEPVVKKMKPSPKIDDLTQIAGIGPKTAAVLNEAGITSFEQLAALAPVQVKQILSKAGVRGNPETWPEQAASAASEK
jgi:predicted flap endonuclease-1-like 5' DNA nuclease